ncbi:hypothetical protein [Thalassomonas actiniarum]|uniref:Uncharacterized protein n=1 Tax=Thalassomonas actiniarum TaxID=485447 RepID=A0AAE9YWS9_9GAMM|nr:hypothetical protein [Thalassomonas actiniarum]WDE01007.1 hypothetical protein SG35_010445 [Thalassomonas actiniarum]
MEWFKTKLQYGVGGYIFFFIFIKVYVFLGIPLLDIPDFDLKPISYVLSKDILYLISQSMMVSAAIELGYMLFTPGPDEAVEPLILGIAGTALLVLSDENNASVNNSFLTDAVVTFLLVVSMFILFFLRYKLKTWFPKEFGDSVVENSDEISDPNSSMQPTAEESAD